MVSHPDLLVGNDTGDDAAVYRLDDKTAIIVTVDFFTPITDDPYEFGLVAAANSLSDVYAMGGKPLVALNIVGFPAELAVEMLGDVLKGGYDKAMEANCLIVGGHTVDDAEPKYGLSVVGLVEPGKEVSNATAQPGDVLVLTKPIGTGIIATGSKAGTAPDGIMKQAIEMMAELNKGASEAMMRVGVNSCTDITGFGLMGHLRGMVRGSGVGATIRVADVPVLPGTWGLLEKGTVPGGTFRNMSGVEDTVDWDDKLSEEQRLLMCDAQTSGGLLISVPKAKLDQLLSELIVSGVETRAVVGEITAENSSRIRVTA
jgi:selenide,water dikinase|tara:strand:+ start:1936 stop:2880 length:945 start_codon:yes stop_codon:yes gene_type:complete